MIFLSRNAGQPARAPAAKGSKHRLSPKRREEIGIGTAPKAGLVRLISGQLIPRALIIPFAVGLVAIAAILNFLAIDVLGPSTPFFFYFPAVLAASLFCGFYPGLIATALSLSAALYFNIDPPYTFKLPPPPDALRMVLFAVVASLICLMNHRLRRATSALSQAEARFRLLIEGVRDYMIFALDSDGMILNWNAGAELIQGYKAEEVLGRHFSLFYPPDSPKIRPQEDLEAALARGYFEEESWRVRKDGRRFWAATSINAVRDEEGRLMGFSNVTRDLTRRKLIEEDLRKSEERFRLLVTNVKDYAIYMLDPEGRVTTWNEGARALKGYSAEEIIGRHFSLFYPNGDRARSARSLETAKRLGRFEDEGWRVRKDGSRFWASAIITAIRDSSGSLAGFSKVTRDLTEPKTKEDALAAKDAQLRRHLKELEKAMVDLEDFSHTVSHDLRAPLRAVQGYAYLVLKKAGGALDAESRALLDRIAAAAQRMDQLVKDLLTYAKTTRGQFKLGLVDLDRIVPRLIEEYALREKAQVTVKPPLGHVIGRDSLIVQAVSNLLDNAGKFMPPERAPTIEIWSEKREGKIRLNIQDNGIGIPEDQYSRIFRPFERLHPEGAYEGTGIGLAIVKKAAERMGGGVGVESEINRGSRFWLELPGSG